MEENLEGDSLLGTDGHGFYKKDTEGLRNGNGLISRNAIQSIDAAR